MKKAFVLTMVVIAAAFAFAGCKDDGKDSAKGGGKLSSKNGISGNTFVSTNKDTEYYSFERIVFNKDGTCVLIDGDEQMSIYYFVDEKLRQLYLYKMKNPDGTFPAPAETIPYEEDDKGNVILKPVNDTGLEVYDEEFIKE